MQIWKINAAMKLYEEKKPRRTKLRHIPGKNKKEQQEQVIYSAKIYCATKVINISNNLHVARQRNYIHVCQPTFLSRFLFNSPQTVPCLLLMKLIFISSQVVLSQRKNEREEIWLTWVIDLNKSDYSFNSIFFAIFLLRSELATK